MVEQLTITTKCAILLFAMQWIHKYRAAMKLILLFLAVMMITGLVLLSTNATLS